MVADSVRLTGKQRAFADAYCGEARFNASEAARQAGLKPGSGWDTLNNTNVRAYIAERLKALTITADGVLAELTDVATAEWRDFVTIKYGSDGSPIDVKMDLGSKVKSLELLAKAHGLLTDKMQLNGELGLRQLVGIDIDTI